MRKGEATRERILEVAEASVLAKGFGATSIDELIAETGITKSGFFYHFRDKNELARALLRRYVETDDRIFDDVFGRAADLTDDPLQAFLDAGRHGCGHLHHDFTHGGAPDRHPAAARRRDPAVSPAENPRTIAERGRFLAATVRHESG